MFYDLDGLWGDAPKVEWKSRPPLALRFDGRFRQDRRAGLRLPPSLPATLSTRHTVSRRKTRRSPRVVNMRSDERRQLLQHDPSYGRRRLAKRSRPFSLPHRFASGYVDGRAVECWSDASTPACDVVTAAAGWFRQLVHEGLASARDMPYRRRAARTADDVPCSASSRRGAPSPRVVGGGSGVVAGGAARRQHARPGAETTRRPPVPPPGVTCDPPPRHARRMKPAVVTRSARGESWTSTTRRRPAAASAASHACSWAQVRVGRGDLEVGEELARASGSSSPGVVRRSRTTRTDATSPAGSSTTTGSSAGPPVSVRPELHVRRPPADPQHPVLPPRVARRSPPSSRSSNRLSDPGSHNQPDPPATAAGIKPMPAASRRSAKTRAGGLTRGRRRRRVDAAPRAAEAPASPKPPTATSTFARQHFAGVPRALPSCEFRHRHARQSDRLRDRAGSRTGRILLRRAETRLRKKVNRRSPDRACVHASNIAIARRWRVGPAVFQSPRAPVSAKGRQNSPATRHGRAFHPSGSYRVIVTRRRRRGISCTSCRCRRGTGRCGRRGGRRGRSS